MYFYSTFMLFLVFSVFLFFSLSGTLMGDKFYVIDYNLMFFDFFTDLNFMFYFDFLANLFLLAVSLITMSAFLYSKEYMEKDNNKNKFLLMTFLFVMSMAIVILSMNFITILIGWDCLGIISYFLVIHYNSDNSDYSGMVTIMSNRIGDISMIFCVYLSFSFMVDNFFVMVTDGIVVNIFVIFICVSAFTKSAQFPFSVWLPLAMAAPTPISALVHSSTLVTAGVYLFIRFDFFFKISSLCNVFLVVLVGLTMLVASAGALSELDIKKIIAYSTLSQLGLMMMTVIMGNEIFSFFHILTHALFKALLFLCSGVLIHSAYENQDIRGYSYNMKLDLFVVCLFFVCSMSLAGFPFLSGFYSKDLILEMMYLNNYNLFYLVFLAGNTVITGVYSFRVIYFSVMLGTKNIKLIFYNHWESINNSLFYLSIGTVVSGSMIYWVLMYKFEIMFMTMNLKLVNILLFMISLLIFNFLFKGDIFFKKMSNGYFLGMFYLNSLQGYSFNILYKNCLIYSTYFEFINEFLIFKKFSIFFENFYNFFLLFKLFLMYFSMLLFPIAVSVFFYW